MPVLSGNPARNGATDALAALVLAPRERSSVREIEALLQNLHKRQQRNDALRDRGAISHDEAVVPTELARVLVARLKEMEDEFELDERSLRESKKLLDQLEKQTVERWKRLEEGVDGRSKDQIQRQLERLTDSMKRVEDDILEQERAHHRGSQRRNSAHKLIEWAETHFKELKP
jgi:hypothetical protein